MLIWNWYIHIVVSKRIIILLHSLLSLSISALLNVLFDGRRSITEKIDFSADVRRVHIWEIIYFLYDIH